MEKQPIQRYANISVKVKECVECPAIKKERSKISQDGVDYICTQMNKVVLGGVEYDSEIQNKPIPRWCPFLAVGKIEKTVWDRAGIKDPKIHGDQVIPYFVQFLEDKGFKAHEGCANENILQTADLSFENIIGVFIERKNKNVFNLEFTHCLFRYLDFVSSFQLHRDENELCFSYLLENKFKQWLENKIMDAIKKQNQIASDLIRGIK